MDVGVRELKARLSHYLDRAARGETIRVTERGRAKAILGPPPAATLNQGIEEGWITSATSAPPRPPRRHTSDRTIADLLAEDRGD